MEKSRQHVIFIILAFCAVYFVWGSTYLFVAYVVEQIPPFQMAGIRFGFAAFLIYLLSLLFVKDRSVTRTQLKNGMIAGVMFLTIGNGIMSWALQYIDSGFAALLVSAQPLVLLVMLYFIEHIKIAGKSIIGIALGILGMYLLVSQNELTQSENQWISLAGICICLLSWGYASIFVRHADVPKNHFIHTGIQMATGSVTLFIVSFLLGESPIGLSQISAFNWGSLLYLSVFGSVIAFTSFNFLLQHISPEKVSTSTYINPIVAVFLGWYFRDELVTQQTILAAIVLLIGVYFINSNKRKPAQ